MPNKPVVLYVENEDSWAKIAEKALSFCDLKWAKNLDEGLAFLRSEQTFDLILVNMNYSEDKELDGLGLNLLDFLKKEMPEIPRIVYSGYEPTRPIDEYFIKGQGVKEFIPKGTTSNLSDLRRIVENALSENSNSTKKSAANISLQETIGEFIEFNIEIEQIDVNKFEIKSHSLQGQAKEMIMLELDANKIFNLCWKLQQAGFPNNSIEVETETANIIKSEPGDNTSLILEKIGKYLFEHIFVGDIKSAFITTSNSARLSGNDVRISLAFDEKSIEIAKFPWELLHDGRRHILFGADFARYINYPEAMAELEVTPPISVLYMKPRPRNMFLQEFDGDESALDLSLGAVEKAGLVRVTKIANSTFSDFVEEIERNKVHIIHFDGEGAFGVKCHHCNSINFPGHSQCQNIKCGLPLDESLLAKGYLGFEDEYGGVDWVDSKTLENSIYRSNVRLVVLSSCQTSQIGGKNLFNATGPSLLQAGIPAVVSMQLPIDVKMAAKFISGFYSSLARFESLTVAVSNGRRRISRWDEWFVPTLYLRSKNNKGMIFKKGA